MGFVRDKTLPLALRRIDDLDREEHNVDETWVAMSGEDPQWVEELQWEEIYDEQHGRERNGKSSEPQELRNRETLAPIPSRSHLGSRSVFGLVGLYDRGHKDR
ncbi:hypothetical protein V502_01407 [Pseudogymnoascus sp. VKM F-4520 (FW-2644)]|nr:hypothetical protein V502_01407 [Pseudogymnoascus sp. VKM F-4520 (FW-2644)]